MITYQTLQEAFVGLKRHAKWYGVNAFTIDYRSIHMAGLPKQDLHFFSSSRELDLIFSILQPEVVDLHGSSDSEPADQPVPTPSKYALDRVEHMRIAGKICRVARIRALYDNPS